MLEQKEQLTNNIEKLKERFEEEQRDNAKKFTELNNLCRTHSSKFMEYTRDYNQICNRLERLKES